MKEGIKLQQLQVRDGTPISLRDSSAQQVSDRSTAERKSKIWLVWIRLREVHTWYTACTWDFPPAGERSSELLLKWAIDFL